jgi:hypothetical protein
LELVELFQQMALTQYLQLLHQLAVEQVALVVQLGLQLVVLVEELVETKDQQLAVPLEQLPKVLPVVELQAQITVVVVVVVLDL